MTTPDWLTRSVVDRACCGIRPIGDLEPSDGLHDLIVRLLTQLPGLGRFGSPSDFISFAHVSGRNAGVDGLRRRQRYERIPLAAKLALGPLPGLHPEQAIYDAELDEALNALPTAERRALELHLLGFTNSEIEHQLGVGKNEPLKLIARARDKLARHFEVGFNPSSVSRALWASVERAAGEAWQLAVSGDEKRGASLDVFDAAAQARWLEAVRWTFPRGTTSVRAAAATRSLLCALTTQPNLGDGHYGSHTTLEPEELDRYLGSWSALARGERDHRRAGHLLMSVQFNFGILRRTDEAADVIEELVKLALRTRDKLLVLYAVALLDNRVDVPRDLRVRTSMLADLADAVTDLHARQLALYHLTYGYVTLRAPLLARRAFDEYLDATGGTPTPLLRSSALAVARRWPGRIALLEHTWDEAVDAFARAEEASRDITTTAWLAFALAKASRFEEARETLQFLTPLARHLHRCDSLFRSRLDPPQCRYDHTDSVQFPMMLARAVVFSTERRPLRRRNSRVISAGQRVADPAR